MPELIDSHAYLDTVLADGPLVPVSARAKTTLVFTVKRFVLQALLEKAITVVPTRDVMPTLKNVQITVRPGHLRMVASDMELSMITTTEMVDVTAAGTAVFPARKLLDIVREADEDDCLISVIGRAASISINRTTWNLMLAGGADYPAMPEIHEITFHTVDRTDFTAALTAVRYAACRDAARSSLMMVEVKDGRMTACDGSRFQQAVIRDLPCALHIPIGAVDDLLKLMKNMDATDIAIGESDHHLVFRLGTDVLIVNKLLAQFPNMEAQLLRPALANSHPLTVERAELAKAVRRVRIAADPETSAIALILEPGAMTIAARDKYRNEASEQIPAHWSGSTRTLVVNHAFLSDMLTGHPGDTLNFILGDDTKTRKAPLMLRDDTVGTIGVVQQMLGDWITE